LTPRGPWGTYPGSMSATSHKATQSFQRRDIEPRWLVVDANDQVLGRMATRVAMVLRGKHRPQFTPHADVGDFVIVVNAEKVKLTGRKLEQKTYYRHTGYTGHLKSTTAARLLKGPHADRVVRNAVRGMLPKNALGRKLLSKLKIYTGPEHPHAAQKPEELSLG
jgi:large subunit ribosomal protein L13